MEEPSQKEIFIQVQTKERNDPPHKKKGGRGRNLEIILTSVKE